ncbi:AP2 domain protein, partial [human gut metagenome]
TIHEGFVRAWYSWNRQAEKESRPGPEIIPSVYEIQRINGGA